MTWFERRKPFLIDAGERILWTAIAVAIPSVVTLVSDLPPAIIPFATVGLTWLKTFIGGKVGNSDTAALRPNEEDPWKVPLGTGMAD